MSMTGTKTPNYDIPTYDSTDLFDPTDSNNQMQIIDDVLTAQGSAVSNAATQAAQAVAQVNNATAAAEAATTLATQANNAATTAANNALEAKNIANGAATTAGTAQTTATQAGTTANNALAQAEAASMAAVSAQNSSTVAQSAAETALLNVVTPYTATKSGSVISLSEGTSDQIIFVMPSGGYNEGDYININGTSYDVLDTQGNPLKTGAIAGNQKVMGLRNNGVINFNMGSGGISDINVVWGANLSSLPANAEENSIGVVSSTTMNGFSYSNDTTPAPIAHVRIFSSVTSIQPIKITDSITLFPARAMQSTGSGWNEISAYVKRGSNWQPIDRYLFNKGRIAGVDIISGYNDYLTVSDKIVITNPATGLPSSSTGTGLYIPVDFTNVESVDFNILTTGTGSGNSRSIIGVFNNAPTGVNAMDWVPTTNDAIVYKIITAVGKQSISTSGITGVKYLFYALNETTASSPFSGSCDSIKINGV